MTRYSQTITHVESVRSVPTPLYVRYLRIPVKWSVEEIPSSESRPEPSTTTKATDAPYFREKFLGFEDGWGRVDVRGEKIASRRNDAPDWRYALIPQVDQSTSRRLIELNPFDLRTEFLKLDIDDQEKTLRFLEERIGVWNIQSHTGEDYMRINRAIGHRYLSGYASPLPVGELKRAQIRTNHQMEWLDKNPNRLVAEFRRLERFSENPLKMPAFHFEWQDEPKAVVEMVTGFELLNVTLQFDLLCKTGMYICEKCKTRFSSDRKVRYCSDKCRKASAQKALRDRQREQEAQGGKWRTTV